VTGGEGERGEISRGRVVVLWWLDQGRKLAGAEGGESTVREGRVSGSHDGHAVLQRRGGTGWVENQVKWNEMGECQDEKHSTYTIPSK